MVDVQNPPYTLNCMCIYLYYNRSAAKLRMFSRVVFAIRFERSNVRAQLQKKRIIDDKELLAVFFCVLPVSCNRANRMRVSPHKEQCVDVCVCVCVTPVHSV